MRIVPDQPCIDFLQWALPRLGLRWEGFRRVRRQVCRRLRRRLGEIGLADLAAYREYLEGHPEEWAALDALTPITISRFHRDPAVFAALEREVLPALTAGSARVHAWSAGCASGEEAYTLALMAPGRIDVLATDVDPAMLRRAREAAYGASSLKELPRPRRDAGFFTEGNRFVVRPEHRRHVTVRRHDLRTPPPAGPFDLILCRNVAFTYLALHRQREVLSRLGRVLRTDGALVIGLHESLPEPAPGFAPWPGARATFRRKP
jgi:chemotaxis protein methyltransferase CheR